MIQQERELIDGKPHFGEWFGKSVIYLNHIPQSVQEDPTILACKDTLESSIPKTELEVRNKNFIIRFPSYFDHPLLINGTVSIKYMLWGRAYKLMSLLKKGVRRYKKVYRNGKRKKVRTDK